MLQAQPRPTSRVLTVTPGPRGVSVHTERELLTIEVVAPDIVRVAVCPQGTTPDETPALERVLDTTPPWRFEDGTDLVVHLPRLRVRAIRDTGRLVFEDPEGGLLVQEAPHDPRVFEAFDSHTTLFEESKVEKVKTPDGWKDVVVEPRRVFRRRLVRGRFAWRWADEALYGLGQHENGVLNLRGTRQYVHQANLKIALPLLVSSKGYGLLFDTASPLIFNDNADGSYVHLEAVVQPAYYFLAGGNLDGVIEAYRRVTGRASLLPRWCFGYLQCQERYETQDELLAVAREYRARGLPLDAVILDWMSWPEGQWGQKSFDPGRFPDPRGLTAALHDLGVRWMVSLWPNMDAQTDNHRELRDQGHLFPSSDLYNPFSEAARRAYWDQVHRGLARHGVDGWWCDSSEPFTPEWNLVERPEPDRAYREFHETARSWMDEDQTNAYALWHARAIDEGERRSGNRRVVNLTRSAWAGQQSFGTILWSGDTSATWDTLGRQVAAGLGLAASGMPYWTVDVGAFFTKRGQNWFWDGHYEGGNQDPAYRELYLRWFQWATFLPVLRAHGTDTRRELWCFGEPGEVVYDTLVAFLRLRYALVPYLYSLAGDVSLRGASMLRLLAFDFPHDPRVLDCRDQFLLGRALLVCPVTSPLDPSRPSRRVTLPSGAHWWDFWTRRLYPGGTDLEGPAGLETIPLYVRAGSIVPWAPPVAATDDLRDDEIDLLVFPGADGEFRYYQDDGRSRAWESGAWSIIPLEWHEATRTLVFGPREGSWPAMPARMVFRVRLEGAGSTEVVYTGQENRVILG